jgi:hypothetical protein
MTLALDTSLGARLVPMPLQRTWHKRDTAAAVKMRAAELPGMVALPVRELFPWLSKPIWSFNAALGPTDPGAVRDSAREAVQKMDWSRIRRNSRINLLCNPHGFFIAGEAYTVMLEEVVRHVRDALGARVKLCVAESMGHIENQDYAKIYDLAGRFDKYEEVPQCGPGLAVETKLGKMWMMQRLFNADGFIHTHTTELRETYFHRMVDRLLKPFGMSYARLETRSAYHYAFGPRTGQLISRTIFESDFIQKQYAGSVVLDMTPEGALDVKAAHDLKALDRQITPRLLRSFGTLIRLLAAIDECIVIFDSHYATPYCYGGGVTFSNLEYADLDFLDLDNLGAAGKVPPAAQHEGLVMGNNAALKAYVINYMGGGLPMTPMHQHHHPFIVGADVYKWLINDPCNTYLEKCSEMVPDLPAAVAKARAKAGTDKIIAFDNTPGAFRVSESLAAFLRKQAAAVDADVLNNRMPKWLAQRSLA